jgi:hypothetical protein
MRQLVISLMVVGIAQWLAVGWWAVVDGVTVDVSLRMLFTELFYAAPRLPWDFAQRPLAALLDVSPGSILLALAGYLTLRASAIRLWGSAHIDRRLAGYRRELLASRTARSPAPSCRSRARAPR